jgi:hypothetical protein
MHTVRRDLGLLFTIETGPARSRTTAGIRAERSATEYSVVPEGVDSAAWSLRGHTPSVSAFAGHLRGLGDRTRLEVSAALTAGDGGLHLLPRARIAWNPGRPLTLSAAVAGFRQPAQSLRNPESVVGSVFPADLYIGSGAPGVPTARARQVVAAADYRPGTGLRLGFQAYGRTAEGLLLVAPHAGEPFATRLFGVGSGSAYGWSASAAANGARFGFLASYGVQRVRLSYGDSTYIPTYGTTHLAEAGVIVYPTATLALRLGASGAAGRRTTTPTGELEWESCNLRDRGCELGGSPHYGGQPLGARRLPPYLRIDLGVRQHWHVRVAGRNASVAVFGTFSNVLGRRNLLTYVIDPTTGAATAIGMRPGAPLVVGLDWRF